MFGVAGDVGKLPSCCRGRDNDKRQMMD
jgi:hypothetical protein